MEYHLDTHPILYCTLSFFLLKLQPTGMHNIQSALHCTLSLFTVYCNQQECTKFNLHYTARFFIFLTTNKNEHHSIYTALHIVHVFSFPLVYINQKNIQTMMIRSKWQSTHMLEKEVCSNPPKMKKGGTEKTMFL